MRHHKQIAMVIGLVALSCVPAAAAGPKISFDKETHDYGKVRYGDTVSEEFTFTNKGDQVLAIERLTSSCGCTKAVKGSSEVAPSEKSKIVAEFDTNGLKPGRKKKTIYVHSNDPDNPMIKLNLLADVVRDLEVSPPSLAKKIANGEETVRFHLNITNSSDKPHSVSGLRNPNADVEATLTPAQTVVELGASASLDIVVKTKNEPGRPYYMGRFMLLTSHAKENEIELGYLIKVDGEK